MKVRVITAIIGIIAVLGLVYLGGWFLTGAIFLVSLLALLEYDKMLKHFGVHIYLKATAIATAVMVLASGFYSLKAFLAAIFLAFVLLLYLILGIKKENMTGLIYSAFGAVYFGVGFGSLAILRGSHELLSPVAVSMESGIFLILLALICTWASDSFAYLTGKACGRHKMAPHISPNKTMEGLFGGMAGTSKVLLAAQSAASFSVSLFPSVRGLIFWKDSSFPSWWRSWRPWGISSSPL